MDTMRRSLTALFLATIMCQPIFALAEVAEAPLPQKAVRETYRLGSGDKIRVLTFGEDKLSGEFLINGDGLISFPLIGIVRVGRLTTVEAAHTITEKLSNGYMRDPRVQVEVAAFRPVYILGEVAHPGEYPYTEGMTLYTLVARAGGFSYRANSKRVYLRRDGEVVERKFKAGSATPIQPGDTIRIPQRYF